MARISNESFEQLGREKLVGENLSENENRIHIHIEPSKGWVSLRLKELWNYRELFYLHPHHLSLALLFAVPLS